MNFAPLFISFFIVLFIGPVLIKKLKELKAQQTEREIMESHVAKTGTPTMGGVAILTSVFITSLIFAIQNPEIYPVLILTVGFGLIGFIDDFLKVVLRRSDGLIAWQKMLLQILVTTIFAVYLVKFSGVGLDILIPFTDGLTVDIGWVALPILYFAVIGTVNGTNFTDGVDGLATTVTMIVSIFFAIVSYEEGSGITGICLAMAGALMGFLVFNCYPAKIFMGDTGSLALGGFVAGAAYMLHMPLFIIIVGIIYVMEVLSVMIQVSYFKLTHGKRVFRMAPIHHHFELGGWSETKVVCIFSLITMLVCVIGYMAR
ncbi:Phospho-N-acetylmuramoyl-pentapeptide-transferase [Lachnospiraceae bacterium A10]|nr:Phospho-N-acetylmuramoyl-pentapeptide-transferase [Lachnospiraceae bacterium A10]